MVVLERKTPRASMQTFCGLKLGCQLDAGTADGQARIIPRQAGVICTAYFSREGWPSWRWPILSGSRISAFTPLGALAMSRHNRSILVSAILWLTIHPGTTDLLRLLSASDMTGERALPSTTPPRTRIAPIGGVARCKFDTTGCHQLRSVTLNQDSHPSPQLFIGGRYNPGGVQTSWQPSLFVLSVIRAACKDSDDHPKKNVIARKSNSVFVS